MSEWPDRCTCGIVVRDESGFLVSTDLSKHIVHHYNGVPCDAYDGCPTCVQLLGGTK